MENWATHHGKGHRGNIQATGVFWCRPNSKGSGPLLPTSRKWNYISNTTRYGMAGTKTITPPSSIDQVYDGVPEKYATPYFAKVLIVGNKIVQYLPKIGGGVQVKRYMCMHHILEKFMNPNCAFCHAKANEMDSQYAVIVCTVIAPGMDYILSHGAVDIQVPYPIGSKHNRGF